MIKGKLYGSVLTQFKVLLWHFPEGTEENSVFVHHTLTIRYTLCYPCLKEFLLTEAHKEFVTCPIKLCAMLT